MHKTKLDSYFAQLYLYINLERNYMALETYK